MDATEMDTVAEVVERLEREGFGEHFRAEPRGLRVGADGRLFQPEDLVTEEIRRFEGVSDPEDQSIVFALRSRDGSVRGTLVTSFGPGADPEVAEVVRRLPKPERR
jgi:hypothetical protein